MLLWNAHDSLDALLEVASRGAAHQVLTATIMTLLPQSQSSHVHNLPGRSGISLDSRSLPASRGSTFWPCHSAVPSNETTRRKGTLLPVVSKMPCMSPRAASSASCRSRPGATEQRPCERRDLHVDMLDGRGTTNHKPLCLGNKQLHHGETPDFWLHTTASSRVRASGQQVRRRVLQSDADHWPQWRKASLALKIVA